ncbi:MAG: hypothetical protein U9R39_00005 [Campylobacterota bacterium]|nr:hypothetical protein [Campylobacterota bacterium]
MKGLIYFIFNLIALFSVSIIFNGCVASLSYKPSVKNYHSDGGFVYIHKAIDGDDLHSAIITVETYEFYLDLSDNKVLSYAIIDDNLYLSITEGQSDIKNAKVKSLKICKKFSSKECILHSINNKIIGTME